LRFAILHPSHHGMEQTMIATPLIPGRAYMVKYHGQSLPCIAPHPCAALILAARALIAGV
jgi:hypothetical protein